MKTEFFKIELKVTGRGLPLVSVCIVVILLFISSSSRAQNISHPEKVKSVTELVIEAKGAKEVEIKKSFQQFDERGNLTEEIEYEDDGKVKNHHAYEYNTLNQKIKETEYLPDGKVESVSTYTYDENGNRATKTVMDKNGEVKSKKVFRYEYR